MASYIVLVTTNISYAIVVEASLSFIGAGAPPDEPSWGGMLTAGIQALETAPWMVFFPGLAISLAVFGLNLLGDFDPRSRRIRASAAASASRGDRKGAIAICRRRLSSLTRVVALAVALFFPLGSR